MADGTYINGEVIEVKKVKDGQGWTLYNVTAATEQGEMKFGCFGNIKSSKSMQVTELMIGSLYSFGYNTKINGQYTNHTIFFIKAPEEVISGKNEVTDMSSPIKPSFKAENLTEEHVGHQEEVTAPVHKPTPQMEQKPAYKKEMIPGYLVGQAINLAHAEMLKEGFVLGDTEGESNIGVWHQKTKNILAKTQTIADMIQEEASKQ